MTKLWERKFEQRLGQQSYIIRECLVYAGRSTIDANFYSDNLRRSLKQRGKFYIWSLFLWWWFMMGCWGSWIGGHPTRLCQIMRHVWREYISMGTVHRETLENWDSSWSGIAPRINFDPYLFALIRQHNGKPPRWSVEVFIVFRQCGTH